MGCLGGGAVPTIEGIDEILTDVTQKIVDIKGTLEKFIEPDLPEMEQEEAIKNFSEADLKKAIKKAASSGDGNGENIDSNEEKEHFERVKQELLASLERVKKLENEIYGDKEIGAKKTTRRSNKFKQDELVEQKEKTIRKPRTQAKTKTQTKTTEQKER